MATKLDLVRELAEIGLTNSEAEEYVESLLDEIEDQLADGETVQITNFGRFERRKRQGRTMKNPKPGEIHEIDDYYVVHFSPSDNFKSRFEESSHES
jgi:nucleoid DNA-binding protein